MAHASNLARSAVIWTTAFNLFRDVLQFGTMLVLVRILDPALYGQFGMTSATTGFIAIFSFHNFVAHTLQLSAEEEPDYQMHFTAGMVLQGFAFLAANSVAFYFGTTEKYGAIAMPMHVASLTFLLEWPCELRRRMLERNFDWRRLNLLHAVGILAGSVTGLAMGLAGFGIYALVGPGILQAVPFIWDLFVNAKWRPDWSWSWALYREAWDFGIKRTGSGIAIAGRSLAEASTIAGSIGYEAMGIFNRSIGLTQLVCQRPASILASAIYPLLPRIETGSARRTRVGDLIVRLIAWTVIPTAVCLGALAAPVVRVVYGSKWDAVIPLMGIALGYGATLAVTATASMLLLSAQRPGIGLFLDVFTLAGTIVALAFALPRGVLAYLGTLLVVQLIALCACFVLLRYLRLVSVAGLSVAILAAVMASTVSALAAEFALSYLRDVSPSLGRIGFVLWAMVFALTYVMILRLGFARRLGEVVDYLPARRAIRRALVLRLPA